MGNRSILLAIFGLFVGVILIGKLASNEAVDSDSQAQTLESDQASTQNVTESESLQIVNANSKSAPSQAHSVQKTRSSASEVSAEPMTRKLKMSAASANTDEITTRQPAAEELKSFSLALEDRHWKIWDGVTGIPEHIFENKRKGNVVGRVNGFILEKSGADLTLESFSNESPMVVYNERLGSPGVITGTLTMKIKYKDEIKDILSEYKLKTLDSFSEINLYYVTAENQPYNLSELYKSLQKDSRIEKVEPEILNRQYEKR